MKELLKVILMTIGAVFLLVITVTIFVWGMSWLFSILPFPKY